jgi:hypothetical protein
MADVNSTLEPLAESLRADGADLLVEGRDGATLRVRLVLGPEACLDCILPREHLESVLLAAAKQADPAIAEVQLDDPRESETP